MDLEPFGFAIGISDLLQHRACPARFELGMRRHTEGEAPGSTNVTNAYGSAIHLAIHWVEVEAVSNADAIDRAWAEYGKWLDPEDLALLKEDLDQYRGATPLGFRLIAAEKDMRVPLFIDANGTQIYFRFKIDVLLQSIAEPSVWMIRDFKSSKHKKSDAEIHSDPQMSSYAWGVKELYPECTRLGIVYEALRFGNVHTSRNDKQLNEIKDWLVQATKAVMADETLAPTQETFCAFCPLMPTCSETERAVTYWKGTLGVLAPQEKDGRKTVIALTKDAAEVERLLSDVLPRAILVRKHLEAFEKTLKDLIMRMPSSERERMGWTTADRKTKTIPAEGLKRIYEKLGPVFFNLVSISKKNVDLFVGKPEKGKPLTPQLAAVRAEELEVVSSTLVVPEKNPAAD